jgi:mono/diheme cytochrome c family protein
MKFRTLGLIGFLSVALAVASTPTPQDTNDEAPLRPTPVGAGAEMYLNYCASCHGLDGTGAESASLAVKNHGIDLTTLAQRNHGRFPSARVRAAIRGEMRVAAHGSKNMPVWGSAFRYLGGGSAGEVTVRIESLTRYIESLQQPAR